MTTDRVNMKRWDFFSALTLGVPLLSGWCEKNAERLSPGRPVRQAPNQKINGRVLPFAVLISLIGGSR